MTTRSVLYIYSHDKKSHKACYILQTITQLNYYKHYGFTNHTNIPNNLKQTHVFYRVAAHSDISSIYYNYISKMWDACVTKISQYVNDD